MSERSDVGRAGEQAGDGVHGRSLRGALKQRVGVLAAFGVLAAGAVVLTQFGNDQSILLAGFDHDEIARLQPSDVMLLTPGVTIPLPNADERCPVGALDDAVAATGQPVRIVFWHAMTNVLEESMIALTDAYNASQDRVFVQLENQNGYNELVDKFFQSSRRDRPPLVQMPEYMLQQMADSGTAIPIGTCMQATGFDTTPFVESAFVAYQTEGTQWAMPFNVSGPVLYYNRVMFEAAGLDPDRPPVSLDEVREYSQQIVDSGAATYGIAVDHGAESGGGWFLEQWLARLGMLYSDFGNGREGRSTAVLFDTPETVELLTDVQQLIEDGLAVNVGANDSAADVVLKLADPNQPAAMGITTSAGLGTVLAIASTGVFPGIGADDVGLGPMPGPSDVPSALVGGGSLYIVDGAAPAEAAAAWDFITYLISAEAQSQWASRSGYVPLRADAAEIEPLASTWAEDPRFKVAFDQLTADDDLSEFSSLGPVLGPHREIRRATAEMIARIYQGEDVATALAETAAAADLALVQYTIANPVAPGALLGGEAPPPGGTVPDETLPSSDVETSAPRPEVSSVPPATDAAGVDVTTTVGSDTTGAEPSAGPGWFGTPPDAPEAPASSLSVAGPGWFGTPSATSDASASAADSPGWFGTPSAMPDVSASSPAGAGWFGAESGTAEVSASPAAAPDWFGARSEAPDAMVVSPSGSDGVGWFGARSGRSAVASSVLDGPGWFGTR